MRNELLPVAFEYAMFDKDVAGKLRYYAGQTLKVKKATAELIIQTGKILTEVHDLLAEYKTGVFLNWLESECGFSQRTAYNYMAAYHYFGEYCNVAKLEPAAMYVLTKNEKARKKATRLADSGVKVTQKTARALVKEFKEATKDGDGKGKKKGTKKSKKEDRCPNCLGEKWVEDADGKACAKCSHPYGEPVGDRDGDGWKMQRALAIKTNEAEQRAIDDLNELYQNQELHDRLAAMLEEVWVGLKAWEK